MKSVLIVDDKEDNLYYLETLLKGNGYTVVSARHGAEALIKAREDPQDLIISDLLMPVMDGYTLLRHWKADRRLRKIPFVVYTATYTEPEDERLALSLGADLFILKPAEPDDFMSRLREVEARAAAAAPAPPREPVGDQEVLLQEYSEILIRKLEDKSLQLEETNRALEKDIIERERLTETQTAVLNALPAHIALIDPDGVIRNVNASWRKFASTNLFPGQEFGIGQNYLDVCERTPGEYANEGKAAAAGIRSVLRGEARDFAIEYSCPSPDTQRWFRMAVTPLRQDCRAGAVVMHLDVTEHRQAEAKIHRFNRLYAVSSGINAAILRISDAAELYERACRIAVEKGGLVMAWVGLIQPDGFLKPVSWWGTNENYLESIRISSSPELPTGRGPAGQAFRSGQPTCCNDIAADQDTFASKAEALQRGYRSCAACPLQVGGKPIGVFVVYADQPGFFDAEEKNLLSALARNLSYALESLEKDGQKKRVETALRTTEASMAAAQSISRFGSWEIELTHPDNPDANALHWSDEMYRIAGFEPGAVPVSRELFFRLVHPDDRERIQIEVAAAIRARRPYTIVHRLIHPDGAVRIVQQAAQIFFDPESGKPLKMVGTTHDITERNLAQERIAEQAALIDQTRDAIIVRDLDDRCNFWSKGAERLYGWTAEEARGRRLDELLRVDARAFAAANLVLSQKGEWSGELEKTAKSAARLTLDCRWTLLRDPQGLPKSILGTDSDITERKKIETQFLRAQRLESIGTLAGGVAHDLNNALAPILMSIDILQMGETDKNRLGILATIEDSAKRAADMVRQVLSFARGVEGRRVEVQVGQLLRDIAKIANDTFLKNIQIRTNLAHNLWSITGDATQLHQVVLNLCVNARDAMPDGGRLTLSAENFTADEDYAAANPDVRPGNYVVIRVEDTGKGMPPEILDRIFEPFYTTKDLGKGTGLGLSTSLAIAKSHNGFLRVSSEPGKGSTFKVCIPARVEAPAVPRPPDEVHLPRGNGELILVVDDEYSVREMTRRTLEAFGYRVALASDGAAALTVFTQRQRDIGAALIDMMMPVMDGPSTMVVLRRISPGLRIIAASGMAANASVAKATAAGVRHFLTKPFTTEALLRTIRICLQEPAAAAPDSTAR